MKPDSADSTIARSADLAWRSVQRATFTLERLPKQPRGELCRLLQEEDPERALTTACLHLFHALHSQDSLCGSSGTKARKRQECLTGSRTRIMPMKIDSSWKEIWKQDSWAIPKNTIRILEACRWDTSRTAAALTDMSETIDILLAGGILPGEEFSKELLRIRDLDLPKEED